MKDWRETLKNTFLSSQWIFHTTFHLTAVDTQVYLQTKYHARRKNAHFVRGVNMLKGNTFQHHFFIERIGREKKVHRTTLLTLKYHLFYGNVFFRVSRKVFLHKRKPRLLEPNDTLIFCLKCYTNHFASITTNDRQCFNSSAFHFSYSRFVSVALRFLSSPTSSSSRAISQTSPSSTINPSSNVSACHFRLSWLSTGFRTTPVSSSSLFLSAIGFKPARRLACTSHDAYFRMQVSAACLISDTCWREWEMARGYQWMCWHRAIWSWTTMGIWWR